MADERFVREALEAIVDEARATKASGMTLDQGVEELIVDRLERGIFTEAEAALARELRKPAAPAEERIRTTTAIERVHEIVSALATAETLEREADRFATEGNAFRERLARNGAEHSRRSNGESPSIARLRAAVVLLAGITDETIQSVVNPDLDRLSDVLRRIEDGEL